VYRSTQYLTLKQTLVDAILAALGTRPAAALLDTPTVHLYDAPHTPNPVTDTPASFTEASFDGYAAAAITLAGPVNGDNGCRIWRGSIHWEMDTTDDGTPTIYGAYVTDTGGTNLYGQVAFSEPVPLSIAGDFLDLDLAFPVDFSQGTTR
jgi:hypothetical protein